VGSLSNTMYKDLTEEAIPEIQYGEEFSLRVKDKSTILSGIDVSALPPLSGYYGTVAKKGAKVPLMGEYVPIYATHKYGKGTVGSFMCDLGGEWSEPFVRSDVGKALIMNIIESIFPLEAIRADGIKYELKSDNYLHLVNIHGVSDGQTIDVKVTPVSEHLQHLQGKIEVFRAESNSRFTFLITEPGLYKITVVSSDSEGATVSELPIYKTFSYSEEYDTFSANAEDGAKLMSELADTGGGVVVLDPVDVFGSLSETLNVKYDPRFILIITAIILILLDIAVRKFKFKWLHEIIRERKNDMQ